MTGEALDECAAALEMLAAVYDVRAADRSGRLPSMEDALTMVRWSGYWGAR